MSDYPPEVQAVLDAVLDVCRPGSGILTYPPDAVRNLIDAVAAYRKATAPPEPFERAFVFDSALEGGGVSWSLESINHIHLSPRQTAWRCTVTPTERVR